MSVSSDAEGGRVPGRRVPGRGGPVGGLPICRVSYTGLTRGDGGTLMARITETATHARTRPGTRPGTGTSTGAGGRAHHTRDHDSGHGQRSGRGNPRSGSGGSETGHPDSDDALGGSGEAHGGGHEDLDDSDTDPHRGDAGHDESGVRDDSASDDTHGAAGHDKGGDARGGPVPVPEGLASMPPGPDLGAALAGIPVRRVSGYDTVDVMVAAYRQASHARAVFLAALLETGMRQAGSADTVSRVAHPGEFAPEEARAALAWSRRRADGTFEFAWDIHERLPMLGQAMYAGVLDEPRARAFVQWTTGLTDDQAAHIITTLLPHAGGVPVGELVDRIKRMAIAIDPGWAERRYRAAVKGRRVEGSRNDDGTANIAGLDLPIDRAAAACDRIDALARACKHAGDSRPINHIRADLYLGMLDGSFEHLSEDEIIAYVLTHPFTDEPDADDHGGGNGGAGGGDNDGGDSGDNDGGGTGPAGRDGGGTGPAGRDGGGHDGSPSDGDGDDEGTGGTGHDGGTGGSASGRDTGPGGTGPGDDPTGRHDGGGGSDPAIDPHPDPDNEHDHDHDHPTADDRDGRGGPDHHNADDTGRGPEGAGPDSRGDGDHDTSIDDTEPDDDDRPTDSAAAVDSGGEASQGLTPDDDPQATSRGPDTTAPATSTPEPAAPAAAEPNEPGPTSPGPAPPDSDGSRSQPTGSPPTGSPSAGSRSAGSEPEAVGWSVRELRVEIAALLGLNEHPAEIVGWDLVPAALARTVIGSMHGAHWRWVICDQHGRPINSGITRHRPGRPISTTGGPAPPGTGPPSGRRAGIVELEIRADELAHLTAAASAGRHHAWAAVITDIATQHHNTTAATDTDAADEDDVKDADDTAGKDDAAIADARRRSARAGLRRRVQIRDRCCTHPACRAPATRTDQDHATDHARGGPTTEANLGCCCRHDHRLRHDGGWRLSKPAPDTTVWTSPLGHSYVNRPPPIMPALPKPWPASDTTATSGTPRADTHATQRMPNGGRHEPGSYQPSPTMPPATAPRIEPEPAIPLARTVDPTDIPPF